MDADLPSSRPTVAAALNRALALLVRFWAEVVEGHRDRLIAILLGVLAYLIVLGPLPLDPTNIAWLYEGDPAAPYLAWEFFRDSPWAWPIAVNPDYGIEQAASVLYADSNALMALLMKPLSPLLPHPFQYFGLWLMAVFILQALTGLQLMRLAASDRRVQLLGVVVLLFAPPFIARFGDPQMTHVNLTAHWIVIGAIVLCLTPQTRRPILWWTLLMIAGLFVSPYFAPMVAPLWAADFVRRTLFLNRPKLAELPRALPRILLEPAVVFGVSVGLTLLTGIYVTPKSDGGAAEFLALDGFGWFLLNVLSPIDSNGWSFVLPDIPGWGGGEYEGFAYLGLGGLLLLGLSLVALPTALKQNFSLKRLLPIAPLAAVLVGFVIFALSVNVAIGPYHFYLPWPEPLQELGAIFRSTGRFVWPLYYVVFAAAVWLLAQRFAPGFLVAILAAAAVLQLVDTQPGWSGFSARYGQHSSTWPTSLTSPFWNEAASRYARIRRAPPNVTYPFDRDVTLLADLHDLPTDLVFLSRGSPSVEAALQARVDAMIASGTWEPDALFILDEALARRAAATLDPSKDLLALIDGRYVLAPGWKACGECYQPSEGMVPVRN